jgi:hypothetical protein
LNATGTGTLWSCKYSGDGSTLGVGCIGCASSLYILDSMINTPNPVGFGNSSGPYDIDFKANDSNTLISGYYNSANLY